MALLRARELTKTYGSLRALDGVSFEIGEGITGLLGSNGAGKSTSLKLFLGLHRAGRRVGGGARPGSAALARVPRARRLRAGARLPPARRVGGRVPRVHGPRSAASRATAARLRASDVLRHVGLFEERYRPMGTYSTGMKQRVKLAQALVHDPLVAFLDEPTAGLDPLGRREMLELIRRVGGEFGISIVISTHLMGDVERACDSVVVLDAGRLLRTGPVSGFTEETETLEVELVEGADAGGGGAPPPGPRAAARRQASDARGRVRRRLRRRPRRRRRRGALLYRLAPARHSLADVFAGEATGDDPRTPEGDVR